MILKKTALIRTLVLGALLVFMLIGLPAWGAEQPALRAAVTVDGPLVTLGDLLEGAGEAADIAVFRAPDPGTSGKIGANRVLAAATQHGVTGIHGDGIEWISVTRSGRAITMSQVESRIAEHLVAEGLVGASADAEIRLDRFDGTRHVEAASVEPLSIKSFEHDPRTGRFAAVLAVADSRLLGAGLRVVGRAVEVVDVPVLIRNVKRGETVSAADVVMERMARSGLRDDAILMPEGIIGLAARRSLRAGTPISGDSVMEPILVSRNEPVTIVYQVPGLTLTARGRSISAGARGDLVTVINTQSNRTVEAEVTGPGAVTVLPPRRQAAALAATR